MFHSHPAREKKKGGNEIWFSLGPELSGFRQTALWLCIAWYWIPPSCLILKCVYITHSKVVVYLFSFVINNTGVFCGLFSHQKGLKGSQGCGYEDSGDVSIKSPSTPSSISPILFHPLLPRFIFADFLQLWKLCLSTLPHTPDTHFSYCTAGPIATVTTQLGVLDEEKERLQKGGSVRKEEERLMWGWALNSDNHDRENFLTLLCQIRRPTHSETNFDHCSVCLPQFRFLCWNAWFTRWVDAIQTLQANVSLRG